MAVRGRGRRLGLVDVLLIAEFTFVNVRYLLSLAPSGLGVDAVAYWSATHRWLAGEDPYANVGGLLFAAPPPTLAILAPLAALPLPVFGVALLGASFVAALYLLRRLRLPVWYLLFPPLVEAFVVGNPNIIVVALLVSALPAGYVVAAFLKMYAMLPTLLLGRWRAAAWTVAALVVTAPLLPWASFVAHAEQLVTVLTVQSSGGRSALALPLLIPFTIVALALLGRRRAAWLVVPALWPATQFHYSLLALPAANRRMTAILAIPIPGAPAAAVIVEAFVEVAQRVRGKAGAPDAAATREKSGATPTKPAATAVPQAPAEASQ